MSLVVLLLLVAVASGVLLRQWATSALDPEHASRRRLARDMRRVGR